MRLVHVYMGETDKVEDDASVRAHIGTAEGNVSSEPSPGTWEPIRSEWRKISGSRRRARPSSKFDVRILLLGVVLAVLLGWLVAHAV